jgi:hypothetical protein
MNREEIRALIEDAIELTRDLEEPFRGIAFRVVLERQLEQHHPASEAGGAGVVSPGETFGELAAARQPTTHVNRVILFAYHSLHSGHRKGVTIKEIEEAYRQIRERKPQNIPDVIAQCSRRGFLVEGERKEGAKAWVITSRGEGYVENGFQVT